jgi:ribosomal protein S18 acetylase RimI-like enzyme
MKLRTATPGDLPAIVQLYKTVASHPGGIARTADEITEPYVKDFLTKSLADGLMIVTEHPENPDRIIGEIHACRKEPKIFKHVFSDLTLVVDPDFQSKKIGRTIFTIFLEEIALNHHDVGRVELMVRESNAKAISLYQSLGFLIEGRLEMRVKTEDGHYEADIPMGWQNPNFEF